MTTEAASPRSSTPTARVGTGVAVMLLWFAAAVAATVYWVAQQSTEAGGCDKVICLAARVEAIIVVFFVGLPIGIVGLGAATSILVLLWRRIRSGWLLGTLAGVGGLVVGAGVVVGGLLVLTWLVPFFE